MKRLITRSQLRSSRGNNGRAQLRLQHLDERIVPAATGYRVAGYYPEWGTYDRNYQISNVPADKLTNMIYAFANLDASGNVFQNDPYADTQKGFSPQLSTLPYQGNFNQLQLLKQNHPGLRTDIAIGGWTLSAAFSTMAASPTTRTNFANSAVSFMKTYGFDGIDIDWEYPVSGGLEGNAASPADRHNFTLLMQELRTKLDSTGAVDGKHYDLAAAVAAGSGTMQNYEMLAASQYVDWFDVMSYDYHGSTWEATATNNQAALYADPANPVAGGTDNASYSVSQYLAAGVPAAKLQLGAPLYGRDWAGVPATNNGLYQSATGVAMGTWENGVVDYKDLYNRLQTQPATYQSYFDAAAGVPYIYSPTVQGGFFSTYENAASVALKVNYVTSQHLGGMFFWDLSSDLPETNPDSLVRRASDALTLARVQSVQVNNGSAQRSQVTSLKVTFDNNVIFGGSANNAFGLTGPNGVVIPFTSVMTTANTATLNFAPVTDGHYTLTIQSNQILDSQNRQLDGNNDGVAGGNSTFAFHRLFGDVNGDGTVNGVDFLAFRLAFLQQPVNALFDFDGDGQVNGNDFLQFRLRFLQPF